MAAEPKRVLIFDDEFDTMHYLKEHLEQTFGWTVELTAEASLLRRLQVERFDLIIVDVMIRPEMEKAGGAIVKNVHFEGTNWQWTGKEFVRRLRLGEFSGPAGTPAQVPVVLLSAIADSLLTGTGNEFLGTVKIVEKPFRLGQLMRDIQAVLSPG